MSPTRNGETIEGLKALKHRCEVVLYSDSKYVVEGITKGWARKWQANGWKRNGKEMAENVDLWKALLGLCEQHDVEFRWVRGHAGNPHNERCDQLATYAAQGQDLPADAAYESGKTQEGTLPLFSLWHLAGDHEGRPRWRPRPALVLF
jgi:ribonuclease HI